jgi:hypothetical protein
MTTTTVSVPLLLPTPQTLGDAVREVISSNIADLYPPNRFRGATKDGLAQNLLDVCRDLINNHDTLAPLEKAVLSHPALLTLEDLVCRYGAGWAFDQTTIQNARARSTYFDQLAGRTRYV